MLKARIAVLVSGGGTNLQALIDAQEAGKLKSGALCLVLSGTEGAYALERAEKHGIPAVAIAKKACRNQADFEERLNGVLEDYGIELIVMAGFLSILSAGFVSRWEGRIINVHPSLIPSFCGAGFYGLRVHEAALQAGVKITGATVHYVNEIPDGGEIIFQKPVHVHANDTPELLQRRVMEQAEWRLLPRAAELVSKKIVRERTSHGKKA